jgi:Holliday junction resolvase RusA-like endonuclease
MDYQDWFNRLREGANYLYSSYPPEKATIQIVGPTPVSFRAKREDKELIEKAIEVQLREIPWICTEDITIRIEWMINNRERYETDRTPDADNIIKPILDSLCGPDGVIVDDCQVV